MASQQNTYDFIVVGAGPGGASVARRLADTKQKPQVLLLEGGGKNEDKNYRIYSDHLDNRILDYSRGKGLGGSSSINFAAWTLGPRDDYEDWARIVGDESFNWTNAQRRYKSIENYDVTIAPKYHKYCKPAAADHGNQGPIRFTAAPEWERVIVSLFDAHEAVNLPLNVDNNSRNPLGVSAFVNSAMGTMRSTAVAYLEDAPPNLTVMTGTPVAKVILEGKKAVGVQTKTSAYHASKEVILSAGALDTIKIMLLSGIGPKADLEQHGIHCEHDMPYLGQTLQDHIVVPLVVQLQPGLSDREAFYNNAAAVAPARREYLEHGTGPLSIFYHTICVSWLKNDAVLSSPEFADLPSDVRARLNLPTNPTFEMAVGTPGRLLGTDPSVSPDDPLMGFNAFVMNPQSEGTVRLASADPDDAMLLDPKFLSHPYDRRTILEAVRSLRKLVATPEFADTCVKVVGMPTTDSDDALMEYIAQNTSTSWHMSCTAKMGRDGDEKACVDTKFRVKGLQGLRIADMSVTPFLPNCHTQSVAYLIGETAAEKMTEEYRLNEE